MSARLAVLALAAFLVVAASAAATVSDSTTLTVFHQIGNIRMGESESEVGYIYGADCLKGCAGVQEGCVLGLRDCVGPIYDYKVTGGRLDVGYIHHRVVYLETTSSHYRSSTGVAVRATIPFGTRWHQFRWHACGPSDGYWLAGTNWGPWPGEKAAARRWWTQLVVNKGRVTVVVMWRGDVNIQGC